MRSKGFKDGLIKPGEMQGGNQEKEFYTIKSTKHNLKLNKMLRNVKPENNNKRIILEDFVKVPHGFNKLCIGLDKLMSSKNQVDVFRFNFSQISRHEISRHIS
jgi:hypothetical protein